MEELTDPEIVSAIRAGATDRFACLLERYRAYVFRIVSGFVNGEDTEDLAQEVFIQVYRSLDGYDPKRSFKNWLAGIATHCCYDHLRRHYRRREQPLSALGDDHQLWLENALAKHGERLFDARESQREAREILHWALASLPVIDRMVLTLVHLEELSIKDAAERLGLSRINVKVRAHRSREKLRKKLAELLSQGA